MKTKQLVFTGLCVALGLALPFAFHSVPAGGTIFLPMHIPVLLCGLICGWPYGLACGIITPFLSSVLTGMPPSPVLPGMLVELAVYGLVGGLLIRWLGNRRGVLNIYIALIGAMLAGRVASAFAKAFVFSGGAPFSVEAWITASFITALPGIIIQLVAIPVVIMALQKAKIITPATASQS